ncbi:MAG: hypothetical protein A3C61_02185 [Candidatus Yanofskybacteria bacterium RIFCSPHIGHO2_02_FULL_39_10]|uniref:Uncharacterized protein n=1 Tax=Candidatus Yanofskybacteria bacterium RIFCSPHIGHO2_02_FULL_39_10 TaxID=1802674 RepID=A0A1F8F8X5_9BACT|nr:MAG: hypothetical protein A3C61_02185 [Candidatus Yanofskybacteria bacterium RIFCSPHIGHO2_02_FULL_39_10]
MKKFASIFIVAIIITGLSFLYNNFFVSGLPEVHKPAISSKNSFIAGVTELTDHLLQMRRAGVMEFTEEELLYSPLEIIQRYPSYFQFPRITYEPIRNGTVISVGDPSSK